MDPADYDHIFKTFLGLPPEKTDLPLCGAVLPDSWDFSSAARPPCPACQEAKDQLIAKEQL